MCPFVSCVLGCALLDLLVSVQDAGSSAASVANETDVSVRALASRDMLLLLRLLNSSVDDLSKVCWQVKYIFSWDLFGLCDLNRPTPLVLRMCLILENSVRC